MELELCLALSNSSPKFPNLKELDLISYVNCEGKRFCDDNSTLSSQSSVHGNDEEAESDGLFSNKRRFDEVESSVSNSAKTLPLFLWDNKQPNEQDNNPKRLCNLSCFPVNKNEGDGIVGWPPLKSYRKNFCHQDNAQRHQQRHRSGNFPAVESGGPRSMYVKAQMEGFMITRKIDLKLHQSYDSLTRSLLAMFGKGHDSVADYELAYQDTDGDWLLAGDVPWRTFMHSVQRLRMLKRDG